MNLLTGQTVFVTAVVTEPLRYIAVEREALRALLFEDGPLSDLVLSTFMQRREALQQVEGIGLEIVGPHSSEATMRMLDFARSNRLPYTWDDSRAGRRQASFPSSGCRAAASCWRPSIGQVSRALGIGRELAPREEVDLRRRRRRPGRPRRRGVRRLRGARDARRREHRARRPGGLVATDRELPRLPGGNHRLGADEPRGHPGAQVQRTDRDAVSRGRARARKRTPRRPARGGARDRRARRHPRDRRAVPAAPGRRSRGIRGAERVLRSRPARGTDCAAPRASPSSAAATQRARPRSGSRAAARS